MDQKLLNKIITFRRELHEYPEISFKQFKTHLKVKSILLEFGVPAQAITQYNQEGQEPTGMIVDISGKAQPKGDKYCIAFRADMDALSMTENNSDLPHQSKNKGAAHMCGHDGHTACLVGFVPLLMNKTDQIPSNRTVRLLFQPSEEGPGQGARFMIQKDCLEGVDQVYGMHNIPMIMFGFMGIKEGPVLSEMTVIQISIYGDGGHGSEPEGLKVSIWKAMQLYNSISEHVAALKAEGRKLECVWPVLHAGERFNVIGEKAYIQGTLRTLDEETKRSVLDRLNKQLGLIKQEGFRVETFIDEGCVTSNTVKETEHVMRVGRKVLGENMVGAGPLPVMASEDFGEYTKIKPGAFFFLTTQQKPNTPMVHTPNFDFNDKIIPHAISIWLELALDRLVGSQ